MNRLFERCLKLKIKTNESMILIDNAQGRVSY